MSVGVLRDLAGPRGLNAYLAGAAGSGMRGLATFLLADGWRVWGADSAGFASDDPLIGLGLRPLSTDTPPPPVSLAIRSAAVPETDPGFAAAVDNGAEPLRYAQMLGRISQLRPLLAVAGSHGKTTVTAWIAYGLDQAGVPAGYLVGGAAPQLGSHASWGNPAFPLVVESCEYDRSFLQLCPQQVALLNVDAEHPDTYPGGLREVQAAFGDFLGNVRQDGKVFAGPEAPDLSASTAARWETVPELPPETRVGLPGLHSRRNAALVAQVLRSFELRPVEIEHALASFRGVGRRLEEVGEYDGCTIVSDYAHHPTEIAATMQALRERHPGRRLVVVFQPHQAVRFQAYHEGFAQALGDADAIVLMEVYRVRDPEDLQISVRELLPVLPSRPERQVAAAETRAAAQARIEQWKKPGDILLFLGAGDIDAFARSLARREVSAAAE